MSVDGWVTTNLKLGSIDDDIEALRVPELKAGLISALRSLKENECALALHGDSLWTGPKEGPIVPLHYEPLRTSRGDFSSPGSSRAISRRGCAPTLTDSFRGSRRSPAAYIWPLRPSEGLDRRRKRSRGSGR